MQEGDEPPFRIRCTAESKYSRCVPLPKGVTFDARREKHGIVVYYVDDKGKARSQLYTLAAGTAKGNPGQAPAVGLDALAIGGLVGGAFAAGGASHHRNPYSGSE